MARSIPESGAPPAAAARSVSCREQVAYEPEKLLSLDRLAHDPQVWVMRELRYGRRGVAGDEDRFQRRAQLRAQPGDDLDASLAVGEVEVGDQEVGAAALPEPLQRLCEGRSSHDFVALRAQEHAGGIAYVWIVFNEKNARVDGLPRVRGGWGDLPLLEGGRFG